MRLNPTDAEKKLWQHIRKRQLKNRKFLRQHPIFYEHWKYDSFCFIPDFYCFQEKLAIELDGPIHETKKEEDIRRDKILSNMGIRVLRIKNIELNDIDSVLNKISTMFNDN
jgi:very-short-patch-repair endonuclease